MITFLQNIDDIPEIRIDVNGEKIYCNNILRAYADLNYLIYGVKDVVKILNRIENGCYTLSELTHAGLILTEGLRGFYRDKGHIWERGKYIRINLVDIVILESEEILINSDFDKTSGFQGENGTFYPLKKKRLPQQ